MNYKEIDDKLFAIKEKGNIQFKKKAYKEAIKLFSEGIKLYEDTGRPKSQANIKTLITQIYTNRAIAFHLLNQQASALSDASYVLTNLDPSNQKALFRRANACKALQRYEDAVRDFDAYMKANPSDSSVKKDLDFCMKKFMEQRKKKVEEEKNKPKIEEIPAPTFKKV